MTAIAYADAVAADGPELDAMARESWIATFGEASSAADLALYMAEAYGPGGRLLRDLGDPAYRFRLARDEGRVMGYAKIGPASLPDDPAPANSVQLYQLYVLPPWQGAGVAAALMQWFLDAARSAAAPAAVLTVWENNSRALAFYRRHGFREVGEYTFMTGNQADRDLVLRLDL